MPRSHSTSGWGRGEVAAGGRRATHEAFQDRLRRELFPRSEQAEGSPVMEKDEKFLEGLTQRSKDGENVGNIGD